MTKKGKRRKQKAKDERWKTKGKRRKTLPFAFSPLALTGSWQISCACIYSSYRLAWCMPRARRRGHSRLSWSCAVGRGGIAIRLCTTGRSRCRAALSVAANGCTHGSWRSRAGVPYLLGRIRSRTDWLPRMSRMGKNYYILFSWPPSFSPEGESLLYTIVVFTKSRLRILLCFIFSIFLICLCWFENTI